MKDLPLLSNGLALGTTLLMAGCSTGTSTTPTENEKPWNVVVIMFDDIGYGDLGCYGGKTLRTPNMDKLAEDGMRFTDFYVTSPVCTPSRVSLMTGRYPKRAGLTNVLWPNDTNGLPESEITLATALKGQGYSTALIGKWHLGHEPQYLPRSHGFDYWYGMPYPNDQDHTHPLNDIFIRVGRMDERWPPLPLYRNEELIEQPTDVNLLTQKYTKEATRYIRQHQDKPFFLYLAHSMPHEWLGASEAFRGKSAGNLYGDAVEELDWSVGQVLDALKESGLTENTLIILCNDNGAARPLENASPEQVKMSKQIHKDHGMGSNDPLRGGKQEYYDGGIRIPAIAVAPGLIEPGTVCRETVAIQDIFPTVAALTGTPLPSDRVIDGKNILPVLTGTGSRPQETLFFGGIATQACRKGPWKLILHVRHMQKEDDKEPDIRLYNLDEDIGEQNNLADQHPEIVSELMAEIEAHNRDMAENH
jgi:arylsulfatase A-like enzyme